ncbi:hypothetical protein SAMD00019534_081970 [Acytostelium subglobosum LB1]|uniref:hypothetical protein n=1 Tax=Acytostelium subglobosum LB1 TaxID=1410327 RepID=UPI0006448D5B|nr:hypothetical protein SAMD00019534_081970 [Acytostelium subglobosum LB1]GAM25022.1 hypothetical protein SAMD00019534_081970 [Acytostelium subglobosum LB1]|eukprot:XP_012752111.1 hypothetical protein SAMD00019534_081970 [Acytostelium subglobosum LB1]
MNYNGYSLILSALKTQGPMTRSTLWELVKDSHLYASTHHFKTHMDILVTTNRVARSAHKQYSPKLGKDLNNLFKFSFVDDHKRNELTDDLMNQANAYLQKTLEAQRKRNEQELLLKAQSDKDKEVNKLKDQQNREEDKKKKAVQEKKRVQEAMQKSAEMYDQ